MLRCLRCWEVLVMQEQRLCLASAHSSGSYIFSIPLPQTCFGCFFSHCDDFCLHISWVQQDSLFHEGLSSSWSFPCCCTDSAWVGWVSAAQPLISLLYLLCLWSLVPPTATPSLCQITATYLLSVQVFAALSIYSLSLLPFPKCQCFCLNSCGIGQMVICTFFLTHLLLGQPANLDS